MSLKPRVSFFILAVSILSGCSSYFDEWNAWDNIKMIIKDNSSARIDAVNVYYLDGYTVIEGDVHSDNRTYQSSMVKGHIDIEILLPLNKMEILKNIPVVDYRLFGKGVNQSKFSAYYPKELSQGTTIKLAFHITKNH